jgi:hypothetical protein
MNIRRLLILFPLSLLLTSCQVSAQDGETIIAIVAAFCLLFGALYIGGWFK